MRMCNVFGRSVLILALLAIVGAFSTTQASAAPITIAAADFASFYAEIFVKLTVKNPPSSIHLSPGLGGSPTCNAPILDTKLRG